eukprot:gene11964-52435_t
MPKRTPQQEEAWHRLCAAARQRQISRSVVSPPPPAGTQPHWALRIAQSPDAGSVMTLLAQAEDEGWASQAVYVAALW